MATANQMNAQTLLVLSLSGAAGLRTAVSGTPALGSTDAVR